MYENDEVIGGVIEKFRKEGNIVEFKHFSSRFNITWNDLRKSAFQVAVSEAIGVHWSMLRLPKAIEWNFLGNAFYPQWGQTETWEWFDDAFETVCCLRGGSFANGGLSHIYGGSPKDRNDSLGFRFIAVFPTVTPNKYSD